MVKSLKLTNYIVEKTFMLFTRKNNKSSRLRPYHSQQKKV